MSFTFSSNKNQSRYQSNYSLPDLYLYTNKTIRLKSIGYAGDNSENIT